MKIGFIGLGNMATAMIGGIIKKGIVNAGEILGSSGTKESVKKAVDAFGICGMESNREVAGNADVLILSVKPQMYEKVIGEIKDAVKKETIIISIAPGKTIAWLSELFGFEADGKLVRCMPNTPALVGEGCTGVCFGQGVSVDEKEKVMRILNSFGKAFEISEHLMDTVVGVSGSSPAYVFLFIEAMADAAVADGMPRKQAYEFAAQAVYGSAKMVLETGRHPAELKDMVCSPGGTTIEAVRVLEEKGFRSAVIEAQKACVAKSKGI
ncbi:MAG: pyrroline-5-carboxylate reductase [Lachnospiraceae bacterium]